MKRVIYTSFLVTVLVFLMAGVAWADGLRHRVEALEAELADLQNQLAQALNTISQLQLILAGIQYNPILELGDYVYVEYSDINTMRGPHVIFHDTNVHIQSGSGSTDDRGSPTGLGNLVVGYNEPRTSGNNRTGSHNIIAGKELSFSSYGGLVVGYGNTISGPYASVSGGRGNTARGDYSSVSGGAGNGAAGESSSVSGGRRNEAKGRYSSISGGDDNNAFGDFSFMAGGGGHEADCFNDAFAEYSVVLGGCNNIAGDPSDPAREIGAYSITIGGIHNNTTGNFSSIIGGHGNRAIGSRASIIGGSKNTARGTASSVSGGLENEAIGDHSSVSGGYRRSASGEFDWTAGTLWQDE